MFVLICCMSFTVQHPTLKKIEVQMHLYLPPPQRSACYNRFEMESRNLNEFTIPLSSRRRSSLMNSAMILRKNAELQSEYIKVQNQIDELIQTRAKLEKTKKTYEAMVEKLHLCTEGAF